MINRFAPVRLAALFSLSLLTACGGGGGGGGTSTPSVPAAVPSGTGQITIQMIGTWEIRSSVVVDTNDPAAQPPLNGTLLVIGAQGVASIGGLSVAQPDLEAVLGFPLDSYVNQVNGKTVLYGLASDRRAQGGIRQQIGVAAGSVDDATISVEQYTSLQSAAQASAVFVRSRYTLAKVAEALQLPAYEAESARARTDSLRDALPPLFGR